MQSTASLSESRTSLLQTPPLTKQDLSSGEYEEEEEEEEDDEEEEEEEEEERGEVDSSVWWFKAHVDEK